ncbi:MULTISPECIES: DUF6117 family protein [unclassified Shinella]|uniref:DUF6117 family protein n=1 Tax=unclassified Shinella TaxID=2643062 RepID=UPI00225D2D8A|nr:DUF6117 family protein [Shinella sp. YE25]MDC7259518.1 hypothetical protein [Shinella sp. YE25]CAI0341291.1 conserved hypothetical protein [Rhizobiaceae bacterium]CAK7260931.1 conserved protein of unknown function [Shinella sp. WSC3-e]
MAIPEYVRVNFRTLLRAAQDGNLALMECLDARTDETRFVLCAVGRDDGDYVFTPFGHLAGGNPYDAYLPPDPGNAGRFLSGSDANAVETSTAADNKEGGHGNPT